MRQFLIIMCLVLFIGNAYSLVAKIPKTKKSSERAIVLIEEIDHQSVRKYQRQILKRLRKRKHIILFFNSPGGVITEGFLLMSFIERISRVVDITCVVEYAGSMAFTVLQSCPKRIGLSGSKYMQHRCSPPSLMCNLFDDVRFRYESYRMGMTFKKWKGKVGISGMFTFGATEALKLGAIDSIVDLGD